MKAMLVIDMPDGSLWKTANDIYERMSGYKCSLKPMPKKLPEISYDSGWYGWTDTLDHVIEDQIKAKNFAKGWNACLEELTGETE